MNNSNIVIIDCNNQLIYDRAHIPNSICLPSDYWLKEKNEDDIARGEHLISEEDFSILASSLGIENNNTIITYDSNQGKESIRVWWVFKYFGHDNVHVLKGGWHNWIGEGNEICNKQFERKISKFIVNPKNNFLIDKSKLICHLDEFQIIDSRSYDEWSGIDSHGNPRAGRIPNAVNLEWCSMLKSDSQFIIDFDKAKRLLSKAGIHNGKPIITYCQAGVRGAFVAFVLMKLGFHDVRLYDGSMFEWSRDLNAPMEKLKNNKYD